MCVERIEYDRRVGIAKRFVLEYPSHFAVFNKYVE